MNSKKRIVVFAPHPDDETWGCGGTIAKRMSEGYEVLIVVMTDGRYAFLKVLGIDSDPTPEELKEIRKEEVKRAAAILNVPEENVLFLNFEDGTLENNEEKAEDVVMEILSKNLPREVYFPYWKDAHPDHRAACRILRKAVKKSGLSTLTYQYTIAQKYLRVGPIIDALLNLLKHNKISVDISKFLPLKEAAVNEFKSEISTISTRQRKPLTSEIKKFLNRKETFYIDK